MYIDRLLRIATNRFHGINIRLHNIILHFYLDDTRDKFLVGSSENIFRVFFLLIRFPIISPPALHRFISLDYRFGFPDFSILETAFQIASLISNSEG